MSHFLEPRLSVPRFLGNADTYGVINFSEFVLSDPLYRFAEGISFVGRNSSQTETAQQATQQLSALTGSVLYR